MPQDGSLGRRAQAGTAHQLQQNAHGLDHHVMRKAIIVMWFACFATALAFTVRDWAESDWEGTHGQRAAILVAVGLGVPGAVNAGLQIHDRVTATERSEGPVNDVTADDRPLNFVWTPEARALRDVLASVLWSQEDIDACVGASGATMGRRPFKSKPDNAWQAAIEVAYSHEDPAVLEDLLDEAASRHPAAAVAVSEFRASR